MTILLLRLVHYTMSSCMVDGRTHLNREMRGSKIAGDSLGGYSWERGRGGGVEG